MPGADFSEARVQQVLNSSEVATLATVQPSGAPLAIAMWYVHDKQALAMISEDGLRKVKNMRRDPRVSVAVEVREDGASRCVTIQGHAEFVEDPARRQPLVEAFFRKYSKALEGRWSGHEIPDDRVLFRIVPDKVFYWGA